MGTKVAVGKSQGRVPIFIAFDLREARRVAIPSAERATTRDETERHALGVTSASGSWSRRPITSARRSAMRTGRIRAAAAGLAAVAAASAALVLAGPASAATEGPYFNCAFQTSNGHYLTAVGGGGRTSDVMHTDATRIQSWEKFTLIDSGDGTPITRFGIQTVYGYFLTAVGGGGRTTDVIHSDAPWLRDWEKLTLISQGNGVYAIQTIDGHYMTAVGGGGRTTDTIHSDATRVGSWERFRVTCNN